MLEVYTMLYDIIDPICTCFVGKHPITEDKEYPYCEINFPNVSPNNSFSDNNLLEIDIWDDKGTDIREIEGILTEINKALNKLKYIDLVIQVSVFKNTPYRLELPDPEIGIQRRQLRYIAKVYYK